jgi:hypothetical protein
MRTSRFVPLFVLALFFVAGCRGSQDVTVSYNSEKNTTTYKTGPYTVSRTSSENYGGSKSIDLRAVARCQGSNCSPSTVQLVFSASGGEELALSGAGGKITADGSTVSWTSAEAGKAFSTMSRDQVNRVIGQFAAVELTLNQVEQIATASSIRGSIGGMSLNLRSGVQSGFQKLLQKIRRGGDGQRPSGTQG